MSSAFPAFREANRESKRSMTQSAGRRSGREGAMNRAAAEPTPAPVLSLERIHKTFGGLVAIEDFSLHVYPGEVVALVGDNGAGKSTLVKVVAGVLKPTGGRLLIDGIESTILGLKARELPILIISHNLDQVFRLSDRICVLRRGKQIGVRDARSVDKNEIVSMITGLGA